MKKLFFAVIAVGIIISGCAKKETIKPVDQSTAEQKPADNKQSEQKAVPIEKVTSLDPAEKDRAALDSAIKALQARLKDVHFDFDKYVVRSEDKPILKEVSDALLQNKNVRVMIEGHCDERGTNEYNLALGDKRANAVKEYLRSLGTPSGRMDSISYGEEKPLCKESTEECWAKNRRAHFALSGVR